MPWVEHPGIPNVFGRWLPETPLSVFDGLDKQGDWILRIEDFASGDIGDLRGFSIEMTNVPEPMTAMGLIVGLIVLCKRRRS
ncbi:MAG: PEP-CTERM sorting domain-containing protein [Fimbriimonadales bacterium]|nr:PEP-CTERM sorting domain-containing protein [Fimbriimonadales bacterium]